MNVDQQDQENSELTRQNNLDQVISNDLYDNIQE